LGEKALLFYALMKKSDDKFEWTEEADVAFAQLKKVLSTPPVLVAPNEKEPLLLYIAATHQVVSTILVVERSKEGKAHGVQRPVYFVSEVLSLTNRGTRTTKNSHIVYSQQHENYGNISRCTQL
jgi:dsDNA-binding SOS-regulon protein